MDLIYISDFPSDSCNATNSQINVRPTSENKEPGSISIQSTNKEIFVYIKMPSCICIIEQGKAKQNYV